MRSLSYQQDTSVAVKNVFGVPNSEAVPVRHDETVAEIVEERLSYILWRATTTLMLQ